MVFLDVFGDATFCRTKETLPTSYQNEQKGGSQAASRHGCLFHLMYLSPETNVPCPWKWGATWKLFGDFRNLEEPIIWSIFRCEVMCVPFRLVGSYFLLRVKRPWFLTKKIIWSNWSNIFLSLKVHHQQLYTKKKKKQHMLGRWIQPLI